MQKIVFSALKRLGHEQLIFLYDEKIGIRCIIAIHSTAMCNPQNTILLGGVRMRNYPTEKDAIRDSLRLSWALTRKLAIANEPCGGMKIVLNNNPMKEKILGLLLAFGKIMNCQKTIYLNFMIH